MKIACVTTVCDECDIIEPFVRNNVKVFDHMFLIDNLSCDSSFEILQKLKKEFPITISSDTSPYFDQCNAFTSKLDEIKNDFDWFAFIDCDEFVLQSKEEVQKIISDYPPEWLPAFKWRLWIPSIEGFRSFNQNINTFKVLINKKIAGDTIIEKGAHQVRNKKTQTVLKASWNGLHLEHHPVRSSEQIISKSLIADYRTRAKMRWFHMDPMQWPPYHIQTVAQRCRDLHFNLSMQDLQNIATSYYKLEGGFPDFQEHIANEISNVDWYREWPGLAQINLTQRLEHQISLMDKQLEYV